MLFLHILEIDTKKLISKFWIFSPQDLSETEKQQLKQREDYLKKKRDLLLATKKESKNNVPPPNTDQKEEESPPKEVKHFHINPWVLSVQVSMLLLKSGNGLKRTRVLPLIFPSYWFCRSFWITSVYEWIKYLFAPIVGCYCDLLFGLLKSQGFYFSYANAWKRSQKREKY